MAENSKIEWTTHTSRCGLRVSPQFGDVREVVTADAKRDAIPSVESEFGVCGEVPDVVSVKIATSVVTAMRARKPVATEDIIAPALQLGGRPQASAFNSLAINIARSILAPSGILSRLGADLRSRFIRMLFTEAITRPSLCRCAHLGTAFVRHALALHRRNECLSPLFPSLFDNFAAGHSHG